MAILPELEVTNMNNDMKSLKLINGNKQEYQIDLPRVVIQTKFINDVALAHILENTGLHFSESHWLGYEAQPQEASQIAALFLTYNFKTRYFNNGSTKNTLMLRLDNHTGFDVTSICFDCVKHNHIHSGGLSAGDRLAC